VYNSAAALHATPRTSSGTGESFFCPARATLLPAGVARVLAARVDSPPSRD